MVGPPGFTSPALLLTRHSNFPFSNPGILRFLPRPRRYLEVLSNHDYTYKLGSVRIGLPSKGLAEDYEAKRREWHGDFFKDKQEPTKSSEPELVDIIRKDPAKYVDQGGKLSVKKLVSVHGISFTTAYKIKAIIDGSELSG